MMAKPMKTLQLHYPVIQFLIMVNIPRGDIHEPEANNCFSIITQVIVEKTKRRLNFTTIAAYLFG